MCLALCGFAAQALAQASGATTNRYAFPIGEKLSYKVSWGVVHVGDAATQTEWVESGGRRLLSIRMYARTTSLVARLYPVNDYAESLVDPVTFLPVRYEQKLSEGGKDRHEVVRFDHAARKAYWESKTKGKKEFEIAPDTRDIVSFMYYMRTKGAAALAKEKKQTFSVVVDDTIYDLTVKDPHREAVRLPRFGRVKSVRFEPEAKFGQIFIRRGRMWMWVSEDPRCLTTRMSARLAVASLRAILVSVEGPGDDFWVRPPAESEKKQGD